MRRVIFLMLIVALGLQARAQIDLGIRGGLNISDIKEAGNPFTDDNPFFNPKPSFHLGAFAKIPTTEKVFLQGEIEYTRKGSRLQDFQGNRINFNIDYFVIPLLVGVQLNDWSVLFGPQIGFSLEELNSNTEFSLSFGTKYYLSDELQIGLRYIQGLSPLNGINLAGSGSISQLRNQVFQVSLSYDLYSF